MMSIRKCNEVAKHLRFAGDRYDIAADGYDRLAKDKHTPDDFKAASRRQARELRRDAMQCRRLANELEIK